MGDNKTLEFYRCGVKTLRRSQQRGKFTFTEGLGRTNVREKTRRKIKEDRRGKKKNPECQKMAKTQGRSGEKTQKSKADAR